MKKRAISIALVLVMLCCLVLSGCGSNAKTNEPAAPAAENNAPSNETKTDSENPAPAKEEPVKRDTRYVICSATPATSANYAYYLGMTKAISTALPYLQFTVSETSGAVDSTRRIRTRDVDLGNSSDSNLYDSVYGLNTFEGDPSDETRIMWNWAYSVCMIAVSKDSGVTSLSDLEGKRFCPGATGTAAQAMITGLLDAMDIHPDYFNASQGDAADAMLSRQIIGVSKNGPVNDSYILQIQASMDIDIISMTEEEIAIIKETYPYIVPYTIPAGAIEGIDHDINTFVTVSCVATMVDNFTQEEGYEMISALLDNAEAREIWTTSFPSGADVDVPGLTASSAVCYLHPGTVQYLLEKGYEVPEANIPPEYVPAT